MGCEVVRCETVGCDIVGREIVGREILFQWFYSRHFANNYRYLALVYLTDLSRPGTDFSNIKVLISISRM